MTTPIQSSPHLPPHRYANHVSTVLRFGRMYRNEAWRESVGLTVPVPRYKWALVVVGFIVALCWIAWCAFSEGAGELHGVIF